MHNKEIYNHNWEESGRVENVRGGNQCVMYAFAY